MFLITSNEKKLREFRRFGLEIEARAGQDIKEVEGTPLEVVVYKALEAGEGAVVEDTVLEIEGEVVVDIKFRLHELGQAPEARWIVTLGHNAGETIDIFEGVIEGRLVKPKNQQQNPFGFDPYFVPAGEERTLAELEEIGIKDDFSARKDAVTRLAKGQRTLRVAIGDIPEWVGKYQNNKMAHASKIRRTL